MSEKKSIKINFMSVLTETAIAIAVFVLLSVLATILINSGNLKLQYVNVVNTIILLLSSILATLIRPTSTITSLMSGIMIILSIIIAAACQRGSGADINSIILSGIIVMSGKVIPSVIKKGENKSKKRKQRKRVK